MNRRNFNIPVGWPAEPIHDGLPKTHVLVSSNALVLPAKRDSVQPPFDVERVPGSWSPHVPEKKPKYKVTWWGHQESSLTIEPVRLSTLSPGTDILVPLTARRSQLCLNNNGHAHGIYANRSGYSPLAYCGLTVNVWSGDAAKTQGHFVEGIPTCKACLEYKAVWCFFTVMPYTDKRVTIKAVTREKTAEEKRLRLPTVYARILDDDFLEKPSYKPPRGRPLVAEVDDEFDDPRERKRASAIDRNRRHEETMARVQGHRR